MLTYAHIVRYNGFTRYARYGRIKRGSHHEDLDNEQGRKRMQELQAFLSALLHEPSRAAY